MSDWPQKRAIAINLYMKGMSKRDALIEAGYSLSVAKTDAASVFDRDDVKKEIQRRQRSMATRAGVDAEWIISRLKSIANANLGDLIEIDKEGKPYYDLKNLSPDHKRALGELVMDEIKEGRGSGARTVRRVRVKMVDKLRALEMLGKHLNLFEDKSDALKVEVSLIDRLQAGRERIAKDEEDD